MHFTVLELFMQHWSVVWGVVQHELIAELKSEVGALHQAPIRRCTSKLNPRYFFTAFFGLIMLLRIANKTICGLRMLKKHPALRKFIVHNKQLFPTETNVTQRKPVVLFELNAMHSAHISDSYDQQFTSAIYDAWMKEWSLEKHQAIISALESFIGSGDFRMDYRHSGGQFSLGSVAPCKS